jgi:hypothetical protein
MTVTRTLYTATVKYGHFPAFLEVLKELRTYEKAQNLPPTRCWSTLAGVSNRVVIETEWPTLADFEREGDRMDWDEKHLRLRQKIGAEVIEGSGEDLIWSEIALNREYQ